MNTHYCSVLRIHCTVLDVQFIGRDLIYEAVEIFAQIRILDFCFRVDDARQLILSYIHISECDVR